LLAKDGTPITSVSGWYTDPAHYLWCASKHHQLDPAKPASKLDTAWRALRDAAGLPGLRFHDLRHTVVTRLLEAGEPDHVVESITGHLSRRMLEHYSHIRLKAKKAALDRLRIREDCLDPADQVDTYAEVSH
jgi:integrase